MPEGRLPIGRRLPTCPPKSAWRAKRGMDGSSVLRWAFIPLVGRRAHEDSRDCLPHIKPCWWLSSACGSPDTHKIVADRSTKPMIGRQNDQELPMDRIDFLRVLKDN